MLGKPPHKQTKKKINEEVKEIRIGPPSSVGKLSPQHWKYLGSQCCGSLQPHQCHDLGCDLILQRSQVILGFPGAGMAECQHWIKAPLPPLSPSYFLGCSVCAELENSQQFLVT